MIEDYCKLTEEKIDYKKFLLEKLGFEPEDANLRIKDIETIMSEKNISFKSARDMAVDSIPGSWQKNTVVRKNRPTQDQFWLDILLTIKTRATCPRRQCAAILVDKDFKQISFGYNGPGSGIPNCIETPCKGSNDSSGDYTQCIATHAEANALLQAKARFDDAVVMYCTTRPCFECCKLIVNSKIRRIIFLEDYPDDRGLNLLILKGINLVKMEISKI